MVTYSNYTINKSATRTLALGSAGNDVKEMQKALKAAGYDVGKADGYFGQRTLQAWKAYEQQQLQGYIQDSKASVEEMKKLMAGGTAKPEQKKTAKEVQSQLDQVAAAAKKRAKKNHTLLCAQHVRLALLDAGIKVQGARFAKHYGGQLEKAGFQPVINHLPKTAVSADGYVAGYTPQAGDIAVMKNVKGGNIAGHIQIFDGEKWTSDKRQAHFYPNQNYKNRNGAYIIYRLPMPEAPKILPTANSDEHDNAPALSEIQAAYELLAPQSSPESEIQESNTRLVYQYDPWGDEMNNWPTR